MRSTVGGILAVDKRVVVLREAVCMGKRVLDVPFPAREDRVDSVTCDIFGQQVFQSVFRGIDFAVVGNFQAGVEERIEPKSSDDVLFAKSEILENRAIRFEDNFGAVGFSLLPFSLRLEFTSFEVGAEELTFAIT